jgi:hypothetical protein
MSKFIVVCIICVIFSLFYFLTILLFCSHKIQSAYYYCVRKLLRIPQPMISREQAIEIAVNGYKHFSINYAENMNLVFSREELRIWIITFTGKKPSSIVRIDNQTGEVQPWRNNPKVPRR